MRKIRTVVLSLLLAIALTLSLAAGATPKASAAPLPPDPEVYNSTRSNGPLLVAVSPNGRGHMWWVHRGHFSMMGAMSIFQGDMCSLQINLHNYRPSGVGHWVNLPHGFGVWVKQNCNYGEGSGGGGGGGGVSSWNRPPASHFVKLTKKQKKTIHALQYHKKHPKMGF